ncbi:hypothetical protein FML25_18935 [Klebsiella oxytoca]|uniref:phospholipase effector Tle1 domain-containing protein n=1 Tax=Klebsiella oxytoca TaxID=571 RepID=UPI001CCA7AE5|nr:DUF2235 domain-containing protein [Klebsiella oxytoca]MBZ7066351.1 hypothetical protein [Klebsiella oxytoca]MBZ7156450.1 hypothetical protein [Klebsiella oxytoca]MBZ7690040.1 hypothetical protein [Klebsiella oxytoca]MBZ7760557.1 hypothetical protein [Klebsiella oxytoca]
MPQMNVRSVLAPPYFPAEGRLPKNIDLVQANVDLQTREEKEFKLTLNAQNGLNNTPPCCKSLHVSLFFDGTNNNEKASAEAKRPNPSNIARLYHTALEDIDSGYYSYYIPGVGTAFPEIGELDFSDAGLRYATGGEARINWALLRIVDAVRHTLTGERLGDSEAKGLAQSLSRDMAGKAKVNKPIRTMRRQVVFRHLFAPLRARAKTHQPKILKIKLFIYGFSRGAAEARAFVNWLTDILDAALLQEKTPQPTLLGWPIAVEFLGLCDTVASVGIARFRWPGVMNKPGAMLTWTSTTAGSRLYANHSGPWGVIRMLEPMARQKAGDGLYRLTVTAPDRRQLQWLLRTELGDGPLALLKLRNFRLPAQIFSAGVPAAGRTDEEGYDAREVSE